MKLVKNSSAINADDLSINLNVSNISSILQESNLDEWIYFEIARSLLVRNRIFNFRLPLTMFHFSKTNIYCDHEKCYANHKMSIEYRKCCETIDCSVKYKIHHCDILSQVRLILYV